MKSECLSILVFILFAIGSLAENVEIDAPPNGTEVHPNDQVLVEVVEVVRPVRSPSPFN